MKQLILTFSILFLALLSACSGKQSNIKYETYHNDSYGYKVEYPNFLIHQGEVYSGDGQKFISEDQEIQMLVYYQFKNDFIDMEAENMPIDKAFEEDLSHKEGVISKRLEKDHYTIESKVGNIMHTHYVVFQDNYYNIYFEYPESEKDRMKGVIEHVIKSFNVEDGNASSGVEDTFVPFLEGFLNDCYWGKNFNSLLRSSDKTLTTYIDSKMDVRRYFAPGTVTKLATRDEEFGFTEYDDFMFEPIPTDDLIFEYVNDNEESTPCELIYGNINVIYYRWIKGVPDMVVNNETFETKPVKIDYPEAAIVAVYLPNAYNNPRGFYFLNTRDGWKLAFVDDSLCGA